MKKSAIPFVIGAIFFIILLVIVTISVYMHINDKQFDLDFFITIFISAALAVVLAGGIFFMIKGFSFQKRLIRYLKKEGYNVLKCEKEYLGYSYFGGRNGYLFLFKITFTKGGKEYYMEEPYSKFKWKISLGRDRYFGDLKRVIVVRADKKLGWKNKEIVYGEKKVFGDSNLDSYLEKIQSPIKDYKINFFFEEGKLRYEEGNFPQIPFKNMERIKSVLSLMEEITKI